MAYSKLLQSFWHINSYSDFESIFAPVRLRDITTEDDLANELPTWIPVRIALFSFIDLANRAAELEINLRKDTGHIVNSRVQIFFPDMINRDDYWGKYIKQFFSCGFEQVEQPKYKNSPINEYRAAGLSIGVNSKSELPFISTYVTTEGFQ